jgi:DNA transformation protein and related proteins
MTSPSSYLQYVISDLFANDPSITARPMFGGYGLYFEGRIFGIIAGDELYFKVDHTNVRRYISRTSKQFSYTKKGRRYKLGYWLVPPDILEDRHQIMEWAKESSQLA